MSNTTIALRSSGVASNTPSLGVITEGELSLNYADGILYYKTASNTLGSIRTTQPAGLTTEIQFNDAGSFGSNSGFTFNKSTGAVTITGSAIVSGVDVVSKVNSAFDTANTKSFTFEQNTAPTTANSADRWVHTDTGVEYHNFGNTSNPVWAEVGPTGTLSNTAPGAISASTINVTYTPATTTGAGVLISAANTQGGTGYADFLKATNISGGATNPNKYFRLTSEGKLEVINSAYTASLFGLDNGGNLTASGTITAGAYTPGQVIKDVMLSNSEVTVVSTTIATSGSNQNFITYNYTPVSSSSYLIVHMHISRYEPQGTTDDAWYSVLSVDGIEISYGWQMVNNDGTGTSGRSGVLFPLTGRYTNSSTSSKQIQVAARRDTADDSITITNSATAIWLRITEIAR